MSSKNSATVDAPKVPVKQRIIHALSYELILLVIGTPILSWVLNKDLSHTGVLWVVMSVIAMLWNMCFNAVFERFERRMNWQVRTIAVRVVHAIGFEGGLLLFTVPIIAWMMQISLWQALLLDIALAICIVVYTFIFQYCYDQIMARKIHRQKP